MGSVWFSVCGTGRQSLLSRHTLNTKNRYPAFQTGFCRQPCHSQTRGEGTLALSTNEHSSQQDVPVTTPLDTRNRVLLEKTRIPNLHTPLPIIRDHTLDTLHIILETHNTQPPIGFIVSDGCTPQQKSRIRIARRSTTPSMIMLALRQRLLHILVGFMIILGSPKHLIHRNKTIPELLFTHARE